MESAINPLLLPNSQQTDYSTKPMSQVSLFYYQRKRRRIERRLEWAGQRNDEIPGGITDVVVAHGVERIEIFAFDNTYFGNRKYDSLRTVDIAATVETLGVFSFYKCENVVEVKIPKESALAAIGRGAFASCTSWTGPLKLPASMTRLGVAAFFGTALKVVDLSSCRLLRTIANSAFENCHALEKILLPPNLEQVEYKAFYCCTSIQEITLPETVRLIDEPDFSFCPSFGKCTSLTTVRLGSLRVLSANVYLSRAFEGCTSLHTIVLPGDERTPISRALWPALLHRLVLTDGGLLGRESSTGQQMTLVFSFLQSRLENNEL